MGTYNSSHAINLPGIKPLAVAARFNWLRNMAARSFKVALRALVNGGAGPVNGDQLEFADLGNRGIPAITYTFVDAAPPPPPPGPGEVQLILPVTWDEAATIAMITAIAASLSQTGYRVTSTVDPDGVGGPSLLVSMASLVVSVDNGAFDGGTWPTTPFSGAMQASGPLVVAGVPRGEAAGLMTALVIPQEAGPEQSAGYPDYPTIRAPMVRPYEYRW